MGRMDGKVAIITGAANGQGAAEAVLFAKEGGKVVATDIQEEAVQQLVDDINADGGEAIAITHNVASEKEWRRVVAKAAETFGKVDVLVNNAGVSEPKTLLNITMEQWQRVMDINLTGCVLGMKYTIPEMQKAGGGSVINISSIGGLVGMAGTSPYTAAKGALRSLSKAAAVEYAKQNVRVNSVHPGIIVTPMIEEHFDDQAKQYYTSLTQLPRLGKPEDIAYGVLYLASDESSFMTGSEMVIDGGWTAL
ncbi:NAD(P)-dependent dehydrogenase (short-subunit alcohol dehydrogenase family) [Scopulibacillus darangshiensis]|uniref:NAD(P)-dependent dehydrogenase (Short-subunit alcohol dehydrogenase family) n=1 Tax=Scopulibacillus darangshiensis TaxID=442528 RepID=A0A4R2P3E9_9BACL|nr:glucose 1-dehydrogenase [Scopulibacillus darangshiensis]TCP29202.1 NAD(P)-dependent dehydrogenase (short-subunit alcohol dehydrogenase family) [Scopulibacillus darangshiensis]